MIWRMKFASSAAILVGFFDFLNRALETNLLGTYTLKKDAVTHVKTYDFLLRDVHWNDFSRATVSLSCNFSFSNAFKLSHILFL